MAGRRGFIILALLISLSAGCTHFREDRTIAAFTDALAAGNMEQLRELTSAQFEQKALRRSESLDDLQVLRVPDKPPAIVEVKEVSQTEKEVTVTEPEGTKNLLYKLVFDETSNRWVVDDIFTKQQQSGVTVSKPITEQMDLLLTIRDFLEVWEEDNRQAVIAITTPRFASTLEALPAPWLARITQQVVGNSQRNKSQRHHKPQVAINGPEAVVRLPRTDGTLQLSMKVVDGSWKVDDAAIQTRREESAIRSVRNRARVINAGTQFVEAFRKGDHAAVQKVATKQLYERALQGADLRSARIPDIMLAPADYELKATVDQATMLVPTIEKVVRIEFERIEEGLDEKTYRVSELGLYDSDAKNELLLSAFFTATKRTREFHKALLRADRKLLSRLSSGRFDQAVWSQAEGLPIQLLPVGAAGTDIVRMGSPEYDGSKTHLTVQHQGGEATYTLINAEGRLAVDDVQVGRKQKRSLRSSLELAIPILAFATGVRENKVRDLQKVSSDDFNRLVWSRAEAVPHVSVPVVAQLTKPIRSMRTRSNQAIVELGTPESGAIVQMERDNRHWVIDDIEIVNGLAPSQHVQLKNTMRSEMIVELKGLRAKRDTNGVAARTATVQRKRFDLSLKEPKPTTTKPKSLGLPPKSASDIIPVSGTESEADPGVQHAVMFAPMDEDKVRPASGTSAACGPEGCDLPQKGHPGLINPSGNATPMTKPPVVQVEAAPESDMDLDALFSDFDTPPSAPSATPLPEVAPRVTSPGPVTAPAAVGSPVVRLNDTSRVTDPALHPIKIPMR